MSVKLSVNQLIKAVGRSTFHLVGRVLVGACVFEWVCGMGIGKLRPQRADQCVAELVVPDALVLDHLSSRPV